MSLLKLPAELLLEVATHLHSKDIAAQLQTCRYLSSILYTSLTDSIFRIGSGSMAREALYAAARKLDKPRVRELLSRGILEVVEHPIRYYRVIYDAVSTQSKSTVMLLLECGVRTDVLDDLGNSVISYAVNARRWDLLELLVEWPGVLAGIKNLPDRNKYEMLETLYAIFADGRDDLIGRVWNLVDDEVLRNESIDVLTNLLLANRLGTFTQLIATNRLNLQDSTIGTGTILHEAIRLQAIPFLEVLLARQDIDINFPDSSGQTPLHAATAMFTDPAIIRLLLEDPRVDCSWVNHRGRTALHEAVANGKLVGVETLLADPGCRFSREPLLNKPEALDGMTALHLATLHSHYNITLSLLAQPEINDLPIDHKGRTPLHLAVEASDTTVIRILLKHYDCRPASDLDRKDHTGQTPLHLAARHKDYLAIDELMRDGRFDLNLCEMDCYARLHIRTVASPTAPTREC